MLVCSRVFNIGVDVCDRLAAIDPESLAIIEVAEDGYGTERRTNYGQLKDLSDRFATVLEGLGLARTVDGIAGDRVAVLLSQRLETAVAHIAAFKGGFVSLPLFTLFGPEALLHRLRDSGARVLVTDSDSLLQVMQIRDQLPALQHVFLVDGVPETTSGLLDFHAELAAVTSEYIPVPTRADDPAVIIYTSGTPGNPKGALHAHRVLLGHLPGVEISHNFLPAECNMIVSSSSALEAPVPGIMGRPVPGHHVDVISASGEVLDVEQVGAIAVRAPDPVMFLGYWNNPEATDEKLITGPKGRWLLTGDRGMRRSYGRLRFVDSQLMKGE